MKRLYFYVVFKTLIKMSYSILFMLKSDMKRLFDLAEIERKQEELRQKAMNNEVIEAGGKAKMLEYVLEHVEVSAFIAVHATDYFPEKGILKPSGHFTFNFLNKFISDNSKKIIQDLQLKHTRMTIHFTLNYVVEGVAAHGQFFTWNTKYAVLIPLKDVIKRVICLNPVDTWIIGELPLPSSAEILMPEKEYNSNRKKWDKMAEKAKIIPYPQKYSLKEAIEVRIRQRGYQLTTGGDHGWFEGVDIQYIQTFIEKSTLLSTDEKERLSSLAVTSGFSHWSDIFNAIARKTGAQTRKHYGTLWRNIETCTEELYNILFNPTYERNISVKDMTSSFSFRNKTIPMLKGQVETYIEKIKKEMSDGEYRNKEEIKSLRLLINEFIKVAKWLEEIIKAAEKNKDLTWEEFLKKERII